MKDMNKKTLLIVFAVFMATMSFAQTTYFDLTATVNRRYQGFSKGDVIKIKGLEQQIISTDVLSSNGTTSTEYYLILEDGRKVPVSISIDRALKFHIKSVDDVWNAAILQDVITSLIKNGLQANLRRSLESESLDYINRIQSNGYEFNDPYLLDYLYSLVNKIAPSTLIDGRPGNVNLLIEDNPELNASSFPNGTIIITTGLLSAFHTEDELVAVLAHEMAHFVLDHSVDNINKMIEEKKRAEALAAFATFMAGIGEIGATVASNGYYVPGAITAATAATAFSVARATAYKMGMRYNHKQENEADDYAVRIIKYLGYDTNALATALNRIVNVMRRDRLDHYYFASYTHPALMERINNVGTPSNTVDANFEKIISFAVTNTAYLKYDNRRFREALEYTSQNINNNVGTADDYLIKANCLLALYDKPETNNEALILINKAKQLEPTNINLYKAEILAQLRLKNKSAATNLLNNYISYLKNSRNNLPKIMNEKMWRNFYNFVKTEQSWAERMKVKLSGMAL